jgi:cytohesin
LYYFEYTTDKEPRGIIPLENIQVREIQDRHKPHCFELYAAGSEFIKACKTDSEGKVVEGKQIQNLKILFASSEKELMLRRTQKDFK